MFGKFADWVCIFLALYHFRNHHKQWAYRQQEYVAVYGRYNDASAAPAKLVWYSVKKTLRAQDTSDPRQTFRHHQTGAEVSGQFGTSAEVSRGHFGTGIELSSSPANITATIGRIKVSK